MRIREVEIGIIVRKTKVEIKKKQKKAKRIRRHHYVGRRP